MNRIVRIALAAFLLHGAAAPVAWSAGKTETGDEWIDTAAGIGDYLQILLPAGGFLSTFFVGDGQGNRWDKEGSLQSAQAFGSAWLTVYSLKSIVAKTRPDGGAKNSFPSGHTMGAFAGASFLGNRYGGWVGVGGYALAGFTGYSRVISDWHFADDVVAGASISMLWGWWFVSPHYSRVSVTPYASEDGGGVSVTLNPDAPARGAEPDTKWRYDFAMGPGYIQKNEISSPTDGGTSFDLASFDKTADPTATAAATFTRTLGERHEVELFYTPYETRDTGTLTEDVIFAGSMFADSSLVQTQWRTHDIRAVYSYLAAQGTRGSLRVGGGLMLQSTYAALLDEATDTFAEVEDVAFLPILHAHGELTFAKDLGVGAIAEGMYLSSDYMADVSAYVGWRFAPGWDLSLGCQFYGRDINTSELTNRADYITPFINVGHGF